MCGIYGFSLKPGSDSKSAMLKFKILGMYNLSRGKDSCGVFIDGTITKGVGELKLFTSFIEEKILPNPSENLVVLGHNRASTRGSHIEKNAHPFLIDDDLVGIHNGTITNTMELSNKHGFKSTDFDVDSNLLYAIIKKDGLEVLNEYKGYAALAFTYKTNPNSLFLYHGSSKNYKAGPLVEERPLFYLEAEEGVYFSSIADALYAIRNSDTEIVYELEHNEVFEVRNGEFTDYSHLVNREEINIYTAPLNSHVGKSTRAFNQNSIGTTSFHNSTVPTTINNARSSADVFNTYHPSLILKETLPVRVVTTKGERFVYIHHNRYWETPRLLCHGIYHLREKGGFIVSENDPSVVYYFWEGVMLEDREAYNTLLELSANKHSFLNDQTGMNWASTMSRYSRYPITNVDKSTQLSTYYRNAFYFKERRIADGNCTYKFSGRNYLFVSGFLSEIKTSNREQLLHKTEADSRNEVDIFQKGGIISVGLQQGVLGGGTHNTTFPGVSNFKSPSCCDIQGSSPFTNDIERDENDPVGKSSFDVEPPKSNADNYFYEVDFFDMESAIQVIGDVEQKALQEFSRLVLEAQSPLLPDDHEVELYTNELIFTAISRKTSIMNLIEEEEHKDFLIDVYDNLLSRVNVSEEDKTVEEEVEPDNTATYLEEIQSAMFAPDIESSLLESTGDFKEEEEDDELFNTNFKIMFERAFQRIKDLRDEADEIAMEDENLPSDTFRQQLAKGIYNGVDNLLVNLRELSDKYNQPELSKQITDYIKTPGAII